MDQYSSRIAKEVLEKFKMKGWNLYRSVIASPKTETDTFFFSPPGDIIRYNLTQHLELGRSYVMLPAVNDPRNPGQVFGALEKVAQKLDRKIQTINLKGIDYPFTGITLEKNGVKIHCPEGIRTTYSALIEALDSLVQAS